MKTGKINRNQYISQKGDVTPPTVTIGEMMELWPPNHKYRTFYLSDCIQGISDDTDGQMDINKVGTILSIYSDELEDSTGKGDGNFLNDIIILGTSPSSAVGRKIVNFLKIFIR